MHVASRHILGWPRCSKKFAIKGAALPCFPCRRCYASRTPPSFSQIVSSPSATRQVYVSRSLDPFFNLSVEHFLLQQTPPDSTILFLYINRPSIVIGRNQNPWVEANLHMLNPAPNDGSKPQPSSVGNVDLVRRRSGGGTVFHDEGNVNYSVICPSSEFTRDKHAEMVVRALRQLGVENCRVNARHDIVLDLGVRKDQTDNADTHATAYRIDSNTSPRSVKVSGSAYKLTRQRALHHGTCLLSSPNLKSIPRYLHSPAKPFIKAKGVDSVSSLVGNVGVSNEAFIRGVVQEFGRMYGGDENVFDELDGKEAGYARNDQVGSFIDETTASAPEVMEGIAVLKSDDWIFGQSPQFELSSHPDGPEASERSPSLGDQLPDARVFVQARYGVIKSSRIFSSSDPSTAAGEAERVHSLLKDRKIYEIRDWNALLQQADELQGRPETAVLARWLDMVLGR